MLGFIICDGLLQGDLPRPGWAPDIAGHAGRRVVQSAGVTTFSVARPSGRPTGVTLVWQLRTDRVESYYVVNLETGQSND